VVIFDDVLVILSIKFLFIKLVNIVSLLKMLLLLEILVKFKLYELIVFSVVRFGPYEMVFKSIILGSELFYILVFINGFLFSLFSIKFKI
jgi:hypothetical protein